MISAERRKQQLLESTATVKGSTKGAVTATIRRVIDMGRADVWFTQRDGGPELLFIDNVALGVASAIAENLSLEFGVTAWIEEI